MGEIAGGMRAFSTLEGYEGLVEQELRTLAPRAKVAHAAPGFLIVEDPGIDPSVTIAEPLHPAFARAEFTYWTVARGGRALDAAIADVLLPALDEAPGEGPALHVWGVDEEAQALERALRRRLGGRVRSRIAADVGQEAIDVFLVRPGEAHVGAHRRTAIMSAFPGGRRRLSARPEAPSRSHLKLEEGLEWAGLPIGAGDVAADIGCSPGGWSFVLLERGLEVHGIDPTPVAPSIASHPSFVHHGEPVRQFAAEKLADLRWVFCDMNGPPLDALGQLERLLPRCRGVAGLFHTIKLSDDPPLPVLADARRRVAALGFRRQRVRHLYHNRAELTLVAER